jgi:hypothetical protein
VSWFDRRVGRVRLTDLVALAVAMIAVAEIRATESVGGWPVLVLFAALLAHLVYRARTVRPAHRLRGRRAMRMSG